MNNEIKVLNICNYSAPYQGNFIASLKSLQRYNDNLQSFYLFPAAVKNTGAEIWIRDMNRDKTVAYIQENSILKNILLLLKIKKKHSINRVSCHFSDLRIDAVIKLLFPSRNVVRFFHNFYAPAKKNVMHLFRKVLWHGNLIVGVSNDVANEAKKALPGFRVVSHVNAIHFARLDVVNPIPKPEGISLLILGWDGKGKGVDLAVKAVARLRDKYDLTLRIVAGKNTSEVRGWVERILGGPVEWLTFLPPTDNIASYYCSSDIFLSPSRQEAFGYAPVEAAYCKNSIVLSQVPGQRELKLEGAYWFESENIEDFICKLENAILELNTPEKIEERERAKAIVEREYSLFRWAKGFVSLF